MSENHSSPAELPENLFWRLYADWFVKISSDRGIRLSTRSGPGSGDLIGFGQPGSQRVNASIKSTFPFLCFQAIENIQQSLVDEVAEAALSRTTSNDLGLGLWYSTTLIQQKY